MKTNKRIKKENWFLRLLNWLYGFFEEIMNFNFFYYLCNCNREETMNNFFFTFMWLCLWDGKEWKKHNTTVEWTSKSHLNSIAFNSSILLLSKFFNIEWMNIFSIHPFFCWHHRTNFLIIFQWSKNFIHIENDTSYFRFFIISFFFLFFSFCL